MPYLTAQQVRDRARSDDISDDAVFTDADIEDYISEFEDLAERYCGQTFEVVASITETVELDRDCHIIVRRPLISVATFTVEDVASTAYEFDTADKAAGIIRFTTPLTGTLSITYSYGQTTPAAIKRACVQYVRAVALRDASAAGRDVIEQGFDGGSTRYSTPDWNAGRPTGYIEVDRILNEYGRDIPGVS